MSRFRHFGSGKHAALTLTLTIDAQLATALRTHSLGEGANLSVASLEILLGHLLGLEFLFHNVVLPKSHTRNLILPH